jgi:hypothetical protein
LTFRGERFAEVLFKPEGEPFDLTFRIPQSSFQIPSLGARITTENLLKAVGIPAEEVESWHHGDVCHSGMDGSNPELKQSLPPPAPDVAYLHIHVTLKPLPEAIASTEGGDSEVSLEKLQDLEARWNAILVLESSIDQMRMRVESAQAEMDAASQRSLTPDEKVHALNADVHVWNKAKTRARYALPKAKEFVHRATWVVGSPERKQLGAVFKDGLKPDTPPELLDKLPEELARLHKAHQVLLAQGGTVHQECKNITAEIQGLLRTLVNNATTNARRKKAASQSRGKFV